MKQAELKAKMMASAEVAIEKLLKEQEALGQERTIKLSDIEEMVVRMGQAIEAEVTQAMAAEQGQAEVKAEKCPWCGQRMHYKGQKAKQVVTVSGEVSIQRAYYYCLGCRQGYFPPR
jgi:hypothetical protein